MFAAKQKKKKKKKQINDTLCLFIKTAFNSEKKWIIKLFTFSSWSFCSCLYLKWFEQKETNIAHCIWNRKMMLLEILIVLELKNIWKKKKQNPSHLECFKSREIQTESIFLGLGTSTVCVFNCDDISFAIKTKKNLLLSWNEESQNSLEYPKLISEESQNLFLSFFSLRAN